MNASVRVTILTDFGTVDGYVGAMKGVVANAAPGSAVEDVAHDIPRGDVTAAMWALHRYWDLYPEGSVHLAVVDPGVGTSRKGLALSADGRFVVAPDNGIVSLVIRDAQRWRAVELARIDPPVETGSRTFHGRDLFAPAAGLLARDGDLDALGPTLEEPVEIPVPEPRRTDRGWAGEVVRVDRFGNLVTNLPGAWAGEDARLEVGERSLAFLPAYGHAEPGATLALVNSDGLVEVAVRGDTAAGVLGADAGTPVRLILEGG